MSYDLHFLPPGDLTAAYDALEANTDDGAVVDEALARRVEDAVTDVLGDVEAFESEQIHELAHLETGIQVSLFPSELGLSVPYWYEGEQADAIVTTVRDLVRRIEEVTGLVAYDPQVDAPFLGEGSAMTAAVFDQAGEVRKASKGSTSSAEDKRSFWKRLFGG